MLRNFKLNVGFRIFLLLGLLLGLVYAWQEGPLYVECFLLFCLTLIAFYNLFQYIDRGNQAVSNFLQGIQYNDFTLSFPTNQGSSSFQDLYASFNQINEKFQALSAAKEAHTHYLNTVVEHVNVGLVCFDQEEKVVLMNQALKKILQKAYLIDLAAFQRLDVKLYQAIKTLPNGKKKLIKLKLGNQLVALALDANEFLLQGKAYRLISFQNIQTELEKEELAAWQKLLRTLRHEIMNSITPITTLAATLDDQLQAAPGQISGEQLADLSDAIHAIRKRSEGLFRFTDSYHHLNWIQKADFKAVSLQAVLQRVMVLFQVLLAHKQIELQTQFAVQPILALVDASLLEQVLINLLKNAIDAVVDTPNPKIVLRLQKELATETIRITVEDNGIGMDPATLSQIFIPFYTTKKEGTGIGLNLCRQIVQLHHGRLEVESKLEAGSIFTISL